MFSIQDIDICYKEILNLYQDQINETQIAFEPFKIFGTIQDTIKVDASSNVYNTVKFILQDLLNSEELNLEKEYWLKEELKDYYFVYRRDIKMNKPIASMLSELLYDKAGFLMKKYDNTTKDNSWFGVEIFKSGINDANRIRQKMIKEIKKDM